MGIRRPQKGTARVHLLCALCLLPSPGSAEPQENLRNHEDRLTTAECIDIHEQAQLEQKDDRLLESRALFLKCTSGGCPGVIEADCAQFYSRVNQLIPSLIITIRDDEEDISRAALWIDGQRVDQQPDGSEILLNPGTHTVRVEIPGKHESKTRTLVIVQGQRRRLVPFAFQSEKKEEPKRTSPAAPKFRNPAAIPAPKTVRTHRPLPVSTYLLAGGAVIGASLGATFGIIGLTRKSRLEDRCAPYCTETQKASVDTPLMIADVGFGVGLAAGAAAVITYLVRSRVPVRSERASALRLESWPGKNLGVSLKVDLP